MTSPVSGALFGTVLVANRGEIAVRVIRTLRALGIRSVAVHSDADADARHVREADSAVRIGPAAARDSYLDVARVLDAAAATGAEAIHPGYGFLAENAGFASACADAGIVFIGPPVHAIEVMGDKIRAKQAVVAAGVPVVPGRTDLGMDDAALAGAAAEVGFPVLLKPSAGGGGKGMRLVHDPARLAEEIVGARREAMASFGDDTLLVERLVLRPRHIEVQVLADAHGTVLHLGERECSLQRRHQKVIEEAPSASLDPATREAMGAAAVEAARSVGYTGAGTVEFVVPTSDPDTFFFLEMNTRLQVEHPVTELVTGIDLVEQQLRVAAGEHLAFGQDDVQLRGHAVEARLYAEDPAAGFLPTGGRSVVVREPSGPGVRVDSALVEGGDVATTYDPMLAKVIAWAPDRAEALARLDAALAGTVVLGVGTNITFLRALVRHPDVMAGRLDTDLIERELHALVAAADPTTAIIAAALHRLVSRWPTGSRIDPWDLPNGWRLSGTAETRWQVLDPTGAPLEVSVRGTPDAAWVRVGDAPPVAASAVADGDALLLTVGGVTRRALAAGVGDATWVHVDGTVHVVRDLQAARGDRGTAGADGDVLSPMPGSVIATPVEPGQSVVAGTPLLVVEAMKMEHTLTAPFDGVLTERPVVVGDQVAVGQLLATVTPVAPVTPEETA